MSCFLAFGSLFIQLSEVKALNFIYQIDNCSKFLFSDQPRQITFHSYQELAGCVVRGTTEERTKLIFQIVPRDSANKVSISSLAVVSLTCTLRFFRELVCDTFFY